MIDLTGVRWMFCEEIAMPPEYHNVPGEVQHAFEDESDDLALHDSIPLHET